jgi:hypothetical protein
MFWIRYKATPAGAYTEVPLMPDPTEVEYPEKRAMTVATTQDGATVVQRPLRDTRIRKWIWKGYRDSDLLAVYRNQWALLQALEYRTRLEGALHPLVEIWEDTVPEGGFARGTAEAKVWTVVKLLRVQRTPKKGGGPVTYEDSTIEFVIEDSSYTGF